MNINEKLAQELKITAAQVEGTVKLLDEGATVPFIARYRKEATGSLEDQVIRQLAERLEYLRGLETRKADILRLLLEQEKLTPELEKDIQRAETLTRLEDIYLPFRPKKRTRATIAREKGVEPLALHLLSGKGQLKEEAQKYITEEVLSADEALKLAGDIIAETMAEDADLKGMLRNVAVQTAVIKTTGEQENTPYEMYYDRSEEALRMASHRVLAINRGEKEGILKVTVTMDEDRALRAILGKYRTGREENDALIDLVAQDAYKRLIFPALERELRSTLTERAEDSSIHVFKENLKSILMQPPIKGYHVMGYDPGFRTGCKVAVLDDTGKYLENATVYPTVPRQDIAGTKRVLKNLVKKHQVGVISLGNGTASRESELVLMEMIEELKAEGVELSYVITNEAGASVYSASKLASEEYPDLDVTIRGAISIARRLQDPMAELVKIEPRSIGVGQYQHDISKKKLDESLSGVVEDAVNKVGVDLNVATPALLAYVSGINKTLAENIVAYRDEAGKFTSRKELKKVKRLGDKAYEQCAGFLRIRDGKELLDNTGIHPESYDMAHVLLKELGYDRKKLTTTDLEDIEERAKAYGIDKLMTITGLGKPTIQDILKELKKPGRDPREELQKPMFRKGVMELKDLAEGMILTGVVRNVADFGAFVDIGVHQDGLVHKSELSNTYVRNPLDYVRSGDVVEVQVLSVDLKRKRISLTMKGLNKDKKQ
ncbi:RNA-binding transcriptional accessory protein [Proteiniclasticum sp. BAD-10]|uniref:RNA-binding transcriptional accessory protein n=1 Tax=Proteiniclasticum sediminis TaxID=2804028 RepID=A0A941HNY7_9CLOT|nr:Tex family protein [Proteiniclasticum sediminis]MBR0574739.1 RNA-binding transcriptional accessory protein [Proteiniclasticum sediminis]